MAARRSPSHIPDKANRVLQLILIALSLILLKCWNLAVLQHEAKKREAERPKRRSIIESAARGTIRDRFNQALAVNKVKYQACLLYPQIQEIPSVRWESGEGGKRVRKLARRDYIRELSLLLAGELGLDAERVEDLIHAKAVFYGNLPFVLKDDLSEREYYRLKMLEKDWPGIHAKRVPKRHYPKGKSACHILGYMGAINSRELEAIFRERDRLKACLEALENQEEGELPSGYSSVEEICGRLSDLEELSYGMNDTVGKMGIEKRFEEELRGSFGKRQVEVDAKGRHVKSLPGYRPPIPGRRILLTISSELQEFAEQLLIQSEAMRGREGANPWIRGGAILAMDPHSGELLAMASHPRFDPNDFIPEGTLKKDLEKGKNVMGYFETESYLGEVWDQLRPLEREFFDPKTGRYLEEEKFLTWEAYLDAILPEGNPVREALGRMDSLQGHVSFQNAAEALIRLDGVEALLAGFDEPAEELSSEKAKLAPFFETLNDPLDRLLLLDLSRLAVRAEWFSEPILYHLGGQKIGAYRQAACSLVRVEREILPRVKELFHGSRFRAWRESHQEEFLKGKREEEARAGRYHRPYLDHLDRKERELFGQFWQTFRWPLLYTFLTGKIDGACRAEELEPFLKELVTWEREISEGGCEEASWIASYMFLKSLLSPLEARVSEQYLMTMRSFKELDRPLFKPRPFLRRERGGCLEKHLAMAFYPRYGYGYARSYGYRQAAVQGSIFKLVTGYAALIRRFEALGESPKNAFSLNPLIIVDHSLYSRGRFEMGYFENGSEIPRIYKGGRVPKSLMKQIGKIDLVGALETSSNPYFALLAADCLEEPEDLAEAARLFSYGSCTGIDLPGEIPGKIPDDLKRNPTGLYSFSIGQHTLVATPLQTAVMLSALANGGLVFKPKIVKLIAGKKRDRSSGEPDPEGREELSEPGADLMRRAFLPREVQNLLIQGMQKVVERMSLWGLNQVYLDYPEAIRSFRQMRERMVGKTSSAESMERLSLDAKKGVQKMTHIWFGAIGYPERLGSPAFAVGENESGEAELVVVVYLKYGTYGNHAAPLAAQMLEKWREIKARPRR